MKSAISLATLQSLDGSLSEEVTCSRRIFSSVLGFFFLVLDEVVGVRLRDS